jgi:tetraacyldisaccharide 4'-kinase
MNHLTRSVERQWYSRPGWLLLLLPLAWLFRLITFFRRRRAVSVGLPVVVVGNINVGGTGKTPAIIALCRALQAAGHKPVVISRGYGSGEGRSRQLPADADAAQYGDEPVLIAKATGCPVVVGADRVASARLTVEHHLGDLILSDDGLQHYRLARDFEIAVLDAQRRLGNGWCLPLGPLREAPHRLRQVDAVLINGEFFKAPWLPADTVYTMQLRPLLWRHVQSGRELPLAELDLTGAVALAGIGNPERFFQTLRALGFSGATQAFPDHHPFAPDDLRQFNSGPVLMTEKDAVKVQPFAESHWWALQVEAEIPPALVQRICQRVSREFPTLESDRKP